MEVFSDLGNGFEQALTPGNLLFAFMGVLIGTLVGVLPGIGRLPRSRSSSRWPSGSSRSAD